MRGSSPPMVDWAWPLREPTPWQNSWSDTFKQSDPISLTPGDQSLGYGIERIGTLFKAHGAMY